jgi:hypothetical protein
MIAACKAGAMTTLITITLQVFPALGLTQQEWCAKYMGANEACNKPVTSLDIPIYDVDGSCAKVHPGYVDACLKAEQRAYDQIKFVWPSLSDHVKLNSIIAVHSIMDIPERAKYYTPYVTMFGYMARFIELEEVERPAKPFQR